MENIKKGRTVDYPLRGPAFSIWKVNCLKKRILCFILVFALLSGLCSFAAAKNTAPKYHSPAEKQEVLHEIAEKARGIGLPEDNPIITEAKRVWQEEETKQNLESYGLGTYWTQTDAVMLARLIYAEARGVGSTMEKAAVVWCVLNRVDDSGASISKVITAPNQFAYSRNAPTKCSGEDYTVLARDVLSRWSMEKDGLTDVGRVLPREYMWFYGSGGHNWFRDSVKGGQRWDWSLGNPYVIDSEHPGVLHDPESRS